MRSVWLVPSSQLRSMHRYQFRPPRKPLFLNPAHENVEVLVGEKLSMGTHPRIGRAVRRRGPNTPTGTRLTNLVRTHFRRILVEAAQRAGDVAFEFLLRNARRLKIENVVEAARRHRTHRRRSA